MTQSSDSLVPVADPRRGVSAIRSEVETALTRVVDSGRYVLGPEHDLFEAEFATYLGTRHCVAVASGTDALELAFKAIGCRPGDEILTAANAGFYATAAARAAGLEVRFADVEPAMFTLSADTVAAALTAATRVVVVTHLYGFLAEVEPIAELCRARDILLVEDCAQASGARRAERLAGAFGDAAAFSFYPTKNLGALGDGGAIATNDDGVAERARTLRQYGWETKYRVTIPYGRNSRLDELQAAVLRTRLPRLDDENGRRRAIVARYADALRPEAGRLLYRPGGDYVAHLAVALVAQREVVRRQLNARGIGTDIHYPIPDHRQPLWDRDRFADVNLPATDYAADHVLTLPCFPELTDNEVDRVCEALAEL